MSGRLKRAAVIGDLTGFGRCALAVSLPVISAMGIQACPMPTAVISAIPYHDGHFYLDMTEGLEEYAAHWEEIGLRFDAVLAGFMCSVKEIEIVTGYLGRLREKEAPLTVVDPVMGDGGEIYSMVSRRTPEIMRRLCGMADVITPNLTEACFLAGTEYKEIMDEAEAGELLVKTAEVTEGAVIVKSVGTAGAAANYLYNKGRISRWDYEPFPAKYQGCGDFFASRLTGELLRGKDTESAFFAACETTALAVRKTWERQTPPREGLLFEEVI